MDHSKIRVITENLMKGQYYIFILLAIIGICVKRNDKKSSLLFLIIAGYFCFYLIWEIKSRYIYSLYPYITLFAYSGILWIENRIIRNEKRS